MLCTSQFSYFSLCFPSAGSFAPFASLLSSTESDRLESDEECLRNSKTPHKNATLDNSFNQPEAYTGSTSLICLVPDYRLPSDLPSELAIWVMFGNVP